MGQDEAEQSPRRRHAVDALHDAGHLGGVRAGAEDKKITQRWVVRWFKKTAALMIQRSPRGSSTPAFTPPWLAGAEEEQRADARRRGPGVCRWRRQGRTYYPNPFSTTVSPQPGEVTACAGRRLLR